MLKYSLGIDISMKYIDVCLGTIDQRQVFSVLRNHRFNQNASGFKALVNWIVKYRRDVEIPLVITMEATGVYHENCAMYLHEAGYSVSVMLPTRTKAHFQSSGYKSKTDKIDAAGLAKMGAEQCLPVWQPMDPFILRLRAKTRRHESLNMKKTITNNQIHALKNAMHTDKEVLAQLKSELNFYNKQIKQLEQEIKQLLKSNPDIYERALKVMSIKGVGLLTTAVVLAETNAFALIKSRGQLLKYCGYEIIQHDSGMTTGKSHVSKAGNAHVRRILHMPALCVVRFGVVPFANLYARTFDRHKVKMKSYVAVQRKLLLLMFALWTKNELFDPQYNHAEIIQKEEKKSSPLTRRGIPEVTV